MLVVSVKRKSCTVANALLPQMARTLQDLLGHSAEDEFDRCDSSKHAPRRNAVEEAGVLIHSEWPHANWQVL